MFNLLLLCTVATNRCSKNCHKMWKWITQYQTRVTVSESIKRLPVACNGERERERMEEHAQ